ncbi:hypothetical protein HPB50_022475 [Hyalomma asiaticum]|uniref:Uncharacterized protein n=1 Tax=Hyalomma asiaticum TaxID=266040 RepID=A0ACB7RYC2_HYAAI|nr:hypothetical protein HPB50_022475 [Hyalomma asiaticum]
MRHHHRQDRRRGKKPTATPALPGAVEEVAKKGEGVSELVEATLSTPVAPASAAPSEPASSEPASEGGGEGDGEQPFTLVTKKRTRRKRSQNTTRKASPARESSDSDSESEWFRGCARAQAHCRDRIRRRFVRDC